MTNATPSVEPPPPRRRVDAASEWWYTSDAVRAWQRTRQRVHQLLVQGRVPGARKVVERGQPTWRIPPGTSLPSGA